MHDLDDARLAKLAADIYAIDRAVRTYHRRLAGIEPWATSFVHRPSPCKDGAIRTTLNLGTFTETISKRPNVTSSSPRDAFEIEDER